MRVCCPACDTDFPIEAGFAEADGKRLAALLAAMDAALGRSMLGYLRLHKPARTQLRMAKAAKLAQEIAELVASGEVSRGGLCRPCTAATWVAGIEQMLSTKDKLRLPLSGHGYLLEVVFGLADKADAVAERTRETDLRQGRRSGPATAAPTRSKLAVKLEEIAHFEHLNFFTPQQADAERAKARAELGADT